MNQTTQSLAKKMQDAEKEATELSALAVSADIPDEIRDRITRLASLIRQYARCVLIKGR